MARVLLILLLCALPLPSQAQPRIHLSDSSLLDGVDDPMDFQPRPVLFVHGHGGDHEGNWQMPGTVGLHPGTSFAAALSQNPDLGIEPYYIEFLDQDRSILEDAQEIGEAIEVILNRHDPDYDLALPPDQRSTHVQVAVVAYSKGTISTRAYLKGLREPVPGLLERPGFHPVSVFVAISPPNHGIAPSGLFDDPTSTAVKQLNNGYDENCVAYDSPAVPWVTDFFESLNGYPLIDATTAPATQRDGEAPGSREDSDPPRDGALYLALYADGNRDYVGGETPSSDCQDRELARNLADDAINIEIPDIPGSGTFAFQRLLVHAYTVHNPEVICVALYAVSHLRRPPAATTPAALCTETNGMPNVPLPPRASVALALDFSGSMGASSCPQATCAARHEVLKEAVELFVQLWSAVGLPRDRLAIATFRSAVSTLSLNGVEQMPVTDSGNATAIAGLVDAEMPGGLTAMGGGLAQAIDLLPNAADIRRVLLLTDGLQNVNPLVVDQGTHREIATTPDPIRLDMLGLPVDTIAIGDGAFTDRLVQIAADSGGVFETTLAPQQDLRQYFVEELITALQGFSPQLVDYRRGALAGDSGAEDFEISNGARKVVFKLSWPRGRDLRLRVEKDGVDMTPFGALTEGPFYRIFSLATPARRGSVTVESGGSWRMVIDGAPDSSYEAAAIVDEEILSYRATLGSADFRAGSPLDLELQLAAEGRPIAEGVTVSATVLAPGQSVGTLLATLPAAEPPRQEPKTSAGQRKLAALLADELIWQSLQPIPRQIVLEGDGKGLYRGRFEDTSVPGSYRVLFAISGENRRLGRLERRHSATARLQLGPLDPARTALTLQTLKAGQSGRDLALHLRPQDRFGNYLGPDYGDRIAVTLPSGGSLAAVSDLGNGSYVVPLTVAADDDPAIVVAVAGEPLFDGKLSDLKRERDDRGLPSWFVILLVVLLILSIVLVVRRLRGP